MRPRDIQQWLRAADVAGLESPYDPDEEFAPEHAVRESADEDTAPGSDWGRFMAHAARLLRSPRAKGRHAFLRECVRMVANSEKTVSPERVELYQLLLQTSSYHTDRTSRLLLLQAGDALLEADLAPTRSDPFKSMLVVEAHHALRAETENVCDREGTLKATRGGAANLHAWVCALLVHVLRGSTDALASEAHFHALLHTMARLHFAVLASGPSHHDRLRPGVLHTAWRTFRGASDKLPMLLQRALDVPANAAYHAIVLQGLLLDVCLHLKHGAQADGLTWAAEVKDRVLLSYTTHVVSAKTAVPPIVLHALDLFVQRMVSSEDLEAHVFPTLQKMLLRSPEVAFEVAQALCATAKIDPGAVLTRFQTVLLSSVTSSNAQTRRHALQLARTLLQSQRMTDPSSLVEALSKSLKPGDAKSEEQRMAQSELVAAIPAHPSSSVPLLTAMASLLQKETQVGSLRAELHALWPHVRACWDANVDVPRAWLQALQGKAQSPKAPLRATTLVSLAEALRTPPTQAAACAWLMELLPAMRASVQAASTSALTSPDAALEGSAAAILLAGPVAQAEDASLRDKAAQQVPLAPLLATGAKPSFLLNDKVVRKLREGLPEALVWHAEALRAVLAHKGYQALHDEALQAAVLALLAEYMDGAATPAHALLAGVGAYSPRLALRFVAHLLQNASALAPHAARHLLTGLLSSTGARGAELLPDLVVLAHASQLHDKDREMWVHLCRLASCDPHEVVQHHADHLLRVVDAAHANAAWATAAEAALTTMTFIAPDVLLGRLCGDLLRDLSVHALEALSEQALAIWQAPADRPYMDVLAKSSTPALDKGRASSMDKWDAEVRASIAAKKAAASGPPSLSKQDQAAVDAQLAKERDIRAHVQTTIDRAHRAARRLLCMMDAHAPEVDAHLTPLVRAVQTCLDSARARALGLTQDLVDALTRLSRAGELRAQPTCAWVLSTILRRIDDNLVPLDYALEALDEAELRALYQLRFLVDVAPLDRATCGFLMPWLADLVSRSALCGDEARDDRTVERMQLALDVLAAHAVYGADSDFARADVLHALLRLVRAFPMLVHDAVAALRAYGEAISRERRGQGALIMLLLEAVLSDERRERSGALQCLVPLDLTELEFPPALWLAMHSKDAALARQIWDENALDVPPEYACALVPLLSHAHAYVREAAAAAMGEACALHPDTLPTLLEALWQLYKSQTYSLEPEYDQYGMVIESTLHRQDPWPVRLAVARTLQALAPLFRPQDVVPFFQVAMQQHSALSDRDERVRRAMLDAATAVVDARGADVRTELLTLLEQSVESQDDMVTEASVVLLGRAAQHLAPTDVHVRRVVDRLLEALRTPSEMVQEAVASCLPPLVRTDVVACDIRAITDALFVDLLRGESYATRRGAAYGLAGVVQGRGVCAMRDLHVLGRLEEAMADTSTTRPRQGALFALEMLASRLQVLLEPYVGKLLEHLLVCFGDTHADVREATQDAARVLMRNLSGQCLKLILPSLLAGLDEKQWRTKKGAVELLGAMAFCAPRQLSAALPAVIPRLSDVLTDSHRQVSAAANQSLKQFGEVITNPEIHKLVPTLLKALIDPNAKTQSALKALLHTPFVHYIDGPSLALIAPILERGLRERSVACQKQAAQIVGHLASLTDARDYVPYLAKYTPLVRGVLVSPVPDARSVAARALGTLVERLGEVHFADLVPSLLQVLQTDATGVDRHGAAQGLAEVLAGLGMERMERLLPTIIENTQASASYVREGHLALLIYLPATFGARFVPHLGKIVVPIVSSMADEHESVREASLRAGRMLIANYTQRAVDLLLPQLEPRLFDERHRVRLSALQLTADLLFRVSGISGKAEVEDDTDEAAQANSSVQQALIAAVGVDRRARLLAAIYVLRQDPSIPVRQTAAHTWKALVHNTPRTAREVLPVMLDILLAALAADSDEQRDMAGRTLGELVRKLGEKILAETVPLLAERAAHAPSAGTRAGVCRAVIDVLANSTKTQLEDHEEALIDIVRTALGDPAAEVRAAAAAALDAMQAHLGERAIDATVPTLLEALGDERAPTAVAALREVVRTQPEVVFPVVVPVLTHVPMSEAHAQALTELLPVAGRALGPQVSAILGSLASTLDVASLSLLPLADALFAALSDIEALHQAMVQLLGWLSGRRTERRVLACELFVHFTQHVSVSWSDYTVDALRKLVALFEEPSEEVSRAALAALDACVKAVPKDEWDTLVVPLRRTLESTGAPGAPLPGLCQGRGAGPFVPVFLHGLLQGSAEQREQGALGLADLVEKSEPESIRPFLTTMVGPLIRLCGDRHAPPVKTAILVSLDTMVHRVPTLVRPFYPQLQRSFQKALSDPASATVRTKAAMALGFLMGFQLRVEGVMQELLGTIHTALEQGSDDGAAEAAALALSEIMQHVQGDKVGPAVRSLLAECLSASFHANEEPREALKKAIADLCAAFLRFDDERAAPLLASQVLQPAPVDVQLAALCLRACMEHAPDALHAVARPPALAAQLAGAWLSEAPSVVRAAREARDMMRRTSPWSMDEAVQSAL
ncbi:translational activator of GCN4 [Malassezia equina]|uniref:Translational activator of GCN4 n=1 Tax=Malassezia equina TaxID=1381935 RepID=A0AAF0EHH7_9BASI|nr:translational activator of GCN4 [Malassezia equina]